MPVYVYFRAVLHWGYSVRVPRASMGGRSLPLPPPSTLVGALAASLLRLARTGAGEVFVSHSPQARGRGKTSKFSVFSSAYILARHLLAAGARIRGGGLAMWSDVSRYATLPYIKSSHLRNPANWLSAVAFGWAVAPGLELEAVLVFNDSLLEELSVKLYGLEAAAAAVHRIGSREGLVTVIDARAGKAEETHGGETLIYAPANAIEDWANGVSKVLLFQAWDPRDPAAYSRTSAPSLVKRLVLVVPLRPEPVPEIYLPSEPGAMLRLRNDWTAYAGDWPRELGVVAGLGGDKE